MKRGIENYGNNSPLLKYDLGFDHGSPYVKVGGEVREVFMIDSILPGGVFDRSGVLRGDIVMDVQILEFYEHLERHRGGNYIFSVVEGGDGPEFGKRTKRTISVTIPPKR